MISQRHLRLFQQALPAEGFESAIEFALASVLANPNFLFRTENDAPSSDELKATDPQQRLRDRRF